MLFQWAKNFFKAICAGILWFVHLESASKIEKQKQKSIHMTLCNLKSCVLLHMVCFYAEILSVSKSFAKSRVEWGAGQKHYLPYILRGWGSHMPPCPLLIYPCNILTPVHRNYKGTTCMKDLYIIYFHCFYLWICFLCYQIIHYCWSAMNIHNVVDLYLEKSNHLHFSNILVLLIKIGIIFISIVKDLFLVRAFIHLSTKVWLKSSSWISF